MEDRFKSEEANMADFMANHLPREDAMAHFPSYYNEVWQYYINHLELMNLLPQISESREAFEQFMHLCKRENQVEIFAAALALQRKKLQIN